MDSKKNTTSPYPAEFRERAVQMVIDHLDSYASLTAAVRDIAARLGCSPDSLRVRVTSSLSAMPAGYPDPAPRRRRASRNSSARTASCGKPTRS